MKIRRIRIRNFRKLRGPIVIDDRGKEIGDGLTVIAGDNEEGKSTILAAVQAAFFERHRIGGEAALAMQPFGSELRPEIGIDFELEGAGYALRKAFCQRPEAELTGAGGSASGDAVEERLRTLLQFEPSKAKSTKPEHRGIWGLFWVEQGTAFARPQLGQTGRETLVAALESEVGQVLGGERGRALIAAIAEKYDAVFTATGRPRGALKEARDRLAELTAACGEIRSKLDEYEGKTDALAKLRARLRSYKDDHSLETAETKLRAAREAQKAMEALQSSLAEAQTQETLAAAALSAAQASWHARQEKIAAIAKHSKTESDGEETLKLSTDALAAAERQRDELQSAFEAARTALGRSEAVLDDAERALRRARAQRDLDELSGQYDKAAVAKRECDRLRAEVERIHVDAAGITSLRALVSADDKARLRLQSIATRLRFAPENARNVTCDGAVVPVEEPLLLTEERRLVLEGFGEVIVTPGGEDLARLRRDAARAAEQLASALQRLGVADVAEAEKQLGRRGELSARVGALEATIKAHAPDGIDALHQRVTLKEAELAELSAGAAHDALAVDEAEARYAAARRTRDQAKAALAEAESLLKAAEAAHSARRGDWLTAQANLNAAQRQRKLSEEALDDERARISDANLSAELAAKTQARQQAAAILEERRREVEQADPEAVRLKLMMSEQALTTIRSDIDTLNAQVRDLEVELRTLGQAGLGEQLAEKEGELERARGQAARIEHEAKAVRLLLDTLRTAERQAKETFLGPVRARITPYLKLLLPDSEVILADDDLAISHLRRGGIDEPFEHLSVGTREQLAVLTRLAFAEFLREKGRPAAVILDDALAYSDDERFERMHLVLRRAAETLQVIVLTCRERDYLSLGAPIIRLAECKGA